MEPSKLTSALRQEPGVTLGERIRQSRKARGLTLQAVADAALLTPGFISQIERGLATPSITSLTNVARALGLDPGDLLVRPPDPGTQTRHGDRPLYSLAPDKVIYERISSHFPGSVLRGLVIHERPGVASDPIQHEGEELFYVIDGTLVVDLEGVRHELNAGDSIHFASTRIHSTLNPTTSVATYLHVCTMDIFGEDRREPIDDPVTS